MNQTRPAVTMAIVIVLSSPQWTLGEQAQQIRGTGASPTAQSGIQVSRNDSTKGMVLVEYRDLRWGRTLTVKSTVSQETAVSWLTQLGDTAAIKSEQDLSSFVAAGQSKGLLAVSGVINGVLITVSSGPAPSRDPPAGIVVVSALNQRTGVRLVTSGAKSTPPEEWFQAANQPAKVEDLVALVEAHRSEGLLAVTSYTGPVRFEVTAFWSAAR